MNKIKVYGMAALALFVAFAMFAAPLAGIAGSASDSDVQMLGEENATSSANGTYTIFVNDGSGSGWNHGVVNAYDAAQAVQNTSFWNSTTDSMAARTVVEWGYENLNTSYGDITTFMGETENDAKVWNVYVYIDGNWVLGNDAIGYYKCFSDYSASWQTANIALEYGADATVAPASLSSYIADEEITLTGSTLVSGDAFATTFYLQLATDDAATIVDGIKDINGTTITTAMLANGVTVKGYGSDCYLALKDALKSNVSGVDAIPVEGYSSYGWIDKIFNLGTVQSAGMDTPSDWTDDIYRYWIIYTGQYVSGDPSNVEASFVLGSYSPLSSSPAAQTSFSLIYDDYIMSA